MELANKANFRDAMAHVDTAVNAITTDDPTSRARSTASVVCSVTDTPPTLLIYLSCSASVWPVLSEHHTLCVNTLATGQEALSALFSGKTAVGERFAAAGWQTDATGYPRLEAVLVSFGCRTDQRVGVGTRDILFCHVVAITHHPEPRGLMWSDRGYHMLMRPAC